MGTMTTFETTNDRAEQLTLLPPAPVPVQFRLDDATRRRGLAHVAAIRAQLEQASQARSGQAVCARSLPARAGVSRAA